MRLIPILLLAAMLSAIPTSVADPAEPTELPELVERWRAELGDRCWRVASSDELLVVAVDKTVRFIDRKSGKERWKISGSGHGIQLVGDLVGRLDHRDAYQVWTTAGELVAEGKAEHLALGQDYFVVATKGQMVCYRKSGKKRWTNTLGRYVSGKHGTKKIYRDYEVDELAIFGDRLVACDSEKIFCFDLARGRRKWLYDCGRVEFGRTANGAGYSPNSVSRMVLEDKTLVVKAGARNILMLSLAKGSKRKQVVFQKEDGDYDNVPEFTIQTLYKERVIVITQVTKKGKRAKVYSLTGNLRAKIKDTEGLERLICREDGDIVLTSRKGWVALFSKRAVRWRLELGHGGRYLGAVDKHLLVSRRDKQGALYIDQVSLKKGKTARTCEVSSSWGAASAGAPGTICVQLLKSTVLYDAATLEPLGTFARSAKVIGALGEATLVEDGKCWVALSTPGRTADVD